MKSSLNKKRVVVLTASKYTLDNLNIITNKGLKFPTKGFFSRCASQTSYKVNRVLPENIQSELEKQLDPTLKAGWLDPNAKENNKWKLTHPNRFRAVIQGERVKLDFSKPLDVIAYYILLEAGLIGQPDSGGNHRYDIHEETYVKANSSVQTLAMFGELQAYFKNSETLGEKLGLFLHITGVDHSVVKENPSVKDIEVAFNAYFFQGSSFNVNRVFKAHSLLAEGKEVMYVQILIQAALFESIVFKTNAGRNSKIIYNTNQFKTMEAFKTWVSKGLKEKLPGALLLEKSIKSI